MRGKLVNPWLTATVSFLPIVFVFAALFLLMPRPLPTLDSLAKMPWYAPIGGIAGASWNPETGSPNRPKASRASEARMLPVMTRPLNGPAPILSTKARPPNTATMSDEAAVDRQRDVKYEAGGRAAQPQHGRRDLLGPAHAADRLLL